MSDAWERIVEWWRGGEVVMPVMLATSLLLYVLLGRRAALLWSAPMRAGDRPARSFGAESLVTRTLTAALPLLGLLGTVTGMVRTFAGLGVVAGAAAKAREAGAGIGLALTATQFGRALALPAVIAEWALRRRLERLELRRDLDSCARAASGSG